MQKASIKENTEQLVTALTVKGSGDLSISTVNPLGTNVIYNYDYYKNTGWMSQSLIDKIDAWETKISGSQAQYADLLTLLKDTSASQLTLETELTTLNGQLKSLILIRDAEIQQGLDLSEINIQIDAKNVEIASKQSEIDSSGSSISNITSQLTTINSALSFPNNFTTDEISVLSAFTIENSYINDNFIQTDTMTNVEIQEQAQALYDQAQVILTKISQPRYTVEIDAANFVLLQEYQIFTNQLEMGATFNLELSEGTIIKPVLLGLDINYDDPTDFKITLSNRLRLSDGSFDYTDLFSDTIKHAN